MLKLLKLNNENSFKNLKIFLEKRKSIQKNQTTIVSKIIKNVKKNGDKAVINYEKKFSKIKKIKSDKLFFTNQEINNISKKTNLTIKKSIDIAFNCVGYFGYDNIKKLNIDQLLLTFQLNVFSSIIISSNLLQFTKKKVKN